MGSKVRRGGASPLYSLFGLMLVFSPMFGPSEAYVFPQYDQLPETMFASRIALMVSFVLSCSLFLYYDKLSPKGRRNAVVLCAGLCALSMMLTALPALGAAEEFLIAGGIIRGLGYGTLALVWIDYFTRLRGNGVGVALTESLLAYGLACTICAFVSQYSIILAAILLAACPLASGLGCILLERKGPAPQPVPSKQEPLSKFGQAAFALANFGYGFVFGIMLNGMRAMESTFVSVEFTLMAAVLVIVFLAYGRASDYARGLRIYSLVAAVALLACVVVDSSAPDATPYLISMLWACQIFFSNLVFIDTEFSVPGISHAAGGRGVGHPWSGCFGGGSVPIHPAGGR